MRNTGGARKQAATPRQTVQFSHASRVQGGVHARAVGSYIPSLTKSAFAKYGFSAATLLTDWKSIVGADLAQYTEPERLKWPVRAQVPASEDAEEQGRPGATLVLRVDAGRALDVQYRARQVVERINAYFGYRAVADLRLVQAALKKAAPPERVARTEPSKIALPGVTDGALRAALELMAHGIVMRKGA
ncbi:MAG: DUF721 domain-containing protein [Hyphomicrobiaceae bacterium]